VKTVRKALIICLIILVTTVAYAYRIARPPTISLPMTKGQVSQLNDYLYRIWELQQGEYNLDVVTTAKTSADVGDIWLVQTGVTVRIQYKGRTGHIFTLTPDGY